MPLALVAWQVMAVGRLVRMRGSVKSIYGRANASESQFYERHRNLGYKVAKKLKFWCF
jgi:hypothetical protein